MDLKPNELRIGNSVYQGVEIPVTLTDDMLYNFSKGKIILKPVPITSELLYSLGFVDRSDHKGDGQIFDLENKDWKKSFCVAKAYGPGYVHLGTDRVVFDSLHKLENLFFEICGFELKRVGEKN